MIGIVKSEPSTADTFVARLIRMGVSRVWLTGPIPDKEVRLEHPDLPGVLIIPIPHELKLYPDSEYRVGEHLIERLASALETERNTPHGD